MSNCDLCRHYVPLAAPYHYDKPDYPDGVTVHGFCAKDLSRGAWYPVYLPDSCACKSFQRLTRTRRTEATCAEQIEIGGTENGE